MQRMRQTSWSLLLIQKTGHTQKITLWLIQKTGHTQSIIIIISPTIVDCCDGDTIYTCSMSDVT